ncbi:LysM peptidoglycan-binding domain-containing protein [Streptomyces ipomoeae]|uniref:LysM peptidoglycan-binding domain-containing protein n=1 Tax=Streptomyces ipomoeae TaxID=103232 RepID=UPI0011467976|nr:transglycosylase SLT domain-containing protein [Streptomyces ipomoeae]MDX2938939.1 transglycosylase SLT domain-containing protein [Streptomyces ipomoeae]TQE16300.1 LysM peptidoglycan-binding domain-containing protein [Streptomyces ipomoeae]
MPGRGKHRRPKTNPFTRGMVAAGTGGAALALPLTVATTASATQSAQAAVTSAQAAPQSAPTALQSKFLMYTVVSGDTLSSIARKHGTSGGWHRLYKDNRRAIGSNPALIHPGLKLKLRATKTPKTSTASTTSTTPKTSTATTATTASMTSTASTPSVDTASADTPSVDTASVDTTSAVTATQASTKTYTNDLDGWIRESLDIMAQNGIPGSYDGIYRNIMRESSGNPRAINNWDSNAAAGTPSKGLLQVIDPTFAAYHVPGTADDPYDPVANITAACNYAAARYGSIDNVFGAY